MFTQRCQGPHLQVPRTVSFGQSSPRSTPHDLSGTARTVCRPRQTPPEPTPDRSSGTHPVSSFVFGEHNLCKDGQCNDGQKERNNENMVGGFNENKQQLWTAR